MNDEELSFSGLLAAAARMSEVKNLISNPDVSFDEKSANWNFAKIISSRTFNIH